MNRYVIQYGKVDEGNFFQTRANNKLQAVINFRKKHPRVRIVTTYI